MLHKTRLTQESPSFQLVATTYFKALYPKRIESSQPLLGEKPAGLKMVLMNKEHQFNQFAWCGRGESTFNIYEWLEPARSIEALREARFNRVVVTVEGVEWREGLEILCEIEYEIGARDT